MEVACSESSVLTQEVQRRRGQSAAFRCCIMGLISQLIQVLPKWNVPSESIAHSTLRLRATVVPTDHLFNGSINGIPNR